MTNKTHTNHQAEASRTFEQSALDKLEIIELCFGALGDLLNPSKDLHTVNRDGLSLLFDLLLCEQRKATQQLFNSRSPLK